MAKEALRGIARVGGEDVFLPAWWFEPFGLSMRDFLASRDFQTLIADLRPEEGCGANRSFKPLPLAEDEPKVLMAVAPGFRCGLAVALRLTAQANEMVALWPFVSDGSQHDDVEIDEVILATNRLEALVQGTLPSGLQLTWHDTHFAANRGFYGEGSVHSVILAGIVHQLTAVQNAPIEIAADNPAWSAVRAHSAEGFNADGSLTIQTKGLSMIMPANKDTPSSTSCRDPSAACSRASRRCSAKPCILLPSPSCAIRMSNYRSI